MKVRLIILLGAVVGPICSVYGQTSVTEDILTSVTWQADAGPYRITRDVGVRNGATLTITPGTVVEFGFSGTVFVGNGARVTADSAVFRPVQTRGLDAAFLQYEGSAAGHVEIRRSSVDHLYFYNSGKGDFLVEDTRFTGEGHLRLYGDVPIRVTRCSFESEHPIHTKIDLPASEITDNVFSADAAVFHPHAQRIVRDDTIRTYGNLPVAFANNVSVSKGARLAVLPGLEIRLGYFDSFIVNGQATLEMNGAQIRPADDFGRFPAVIVSLGDGPGHAEITDTILKDVYLQFSGGTGLVERSDFVVEPGDPALVNTGSAAIVATDNYWNGAGGPIHPTNPDGDGAAVNGLVDFTPWAARPHSSSATSMDLAVPGPFYLESPHPNPASDAAEFSYHVASISEVRWYLFDALGRRVRGHPEGSHLPSSGTVSIDVSSLPSGVYILRLHADRHVKARQIIVIR